MPGKVQMHYARDELISVEAVCKLRAARSIRAKLAIDWIVPNCAFNGDQTDLPGTLPKPPDFCRIRAETPNSRRKTTPPHIDLYGR
jgi:hypothetical protein